MEEWKDALNAYEVLGLQGGPKATDADIRKVRTRLMPPLQAMTCSTGAGAHGGAASVSAPRSRAPRGVRGILSSPKNGAMVWLVTIIAGSHANG